MEQEKAYCNICICFTTLQSFSYHISRPVVGNTSPIFGFAKKLPCICGDPANSSIAWKLFRVIPQIRYSKSICGGRWVYSNNRFSYHISRPVVGNTSPIFGFAKKLPDLLIVQLRKHPPHKNLFVWVRYIMQNFLYLHSFILP